MYVTRVLLFLGSALIAIPHTALAHESYDTSAVQTAASPAAKTTTSAFTVTVPDAATELVVDGTPVPGEGTSRTYETRPLAPGVYRYTFTARWQPNTYTTMTRTKTISFRTGERVSVDLTVEDPADRVRVQYVPTPA